MKSIKLLSGLLLAIAFAHGCSTYIAKYDISLVAAEGPITAQYRQGKQMVTPAKDNEVLKYAFEDKQVKVNWIIGSSQFFLLLTNRTNRPIKVVWDDASFVDVYGYNHRLMHSGSNLLNSNQPSSVISRGSNLSVSVFPDDSIPSYNGNLSGTPLLPYSTSKSDIVEFTADVQSYIGKEFQVLLPIEVGNIINDYLFTFRINTAGVYIQRGGGVPDELVSGEDGIAHRSVE